MPLAYEDNELSVTISGDASDAQQAFGDLADSAGRAQGDLDRTGGRADALKGPFKALGGVLLETFSTKVLEGFTDALDHLGQQSKLQAQFGVSPEEAKKASKEAGDLYAQGWGESFGQVQDSMSALARTLNLDITDKALKPLTEKSLALAETFGTEAQDVARAAQSMVTSGVAPSIEAAFDLITKGFQGGLDKSGDFLDTMEEYSILFKGMGLDGATAMGLISQGLKGGARNSDVMADALKEFGIRSKDMSTTSVDAYKALGLNAEEMSKRFAAGGTSARDAFGEVLTSLKGIKDPLQQSLISVGLFGTKAEDLGSALYQMDLSSASSQFGNFSGAAEDMATVLEESPERKVESLKRTVEQKFTAGLMKGGEKLAEFGRGVKDLWNSTDADSPGFMGGLHKSVDWITEKGWPGLKAFGSWVADNFGPLFSRAAEKLGPIVELLKQVLTGWITVVKIEFEFALQFLSDLWSRYGAQFLERIEQALNACLQFISGALQALKGIYDVFIGIFTGDWERAWQGIQDFFSGIWNALGGIVDLAITGVKLAFELAWALFLTIWETAWRKLVEILHLDDIGKALEDSITWCKEKAGDLVTFFAELPGQMKDKFVGMFNGINNAFRDSINWIIRKWNGLEFTLPSINLGPLGSIGGGTIGVPKIPEIPALAAGGWLKRAGTVLVGERGPEFLDLPRGAQVRPLDYGAGGPTVAVNVTVTGSVVAERNLARSIADRMREELQRLDRRNGRAA